MNSYDDTNKITEEQYNKARLLNMLDNIVNEEILNSLPVFKVDDKFLEIAKKYTGSEQIEIKDEDDPAQAKVEENKNDSMRLNAKTATEKKKKKFC